MTLNLAALFSYNFKSTGGMHMYPLAPLPPCQVSNDTDTIISWYHMILMTRYYTDTMLYWCNMILIWYDIILIQYYTDAIWYWYDTHSILLLIRYYTDTIWYWYDTHTIWYWYNIILLRYDIDMIEPIKWYWISYVVHILMHSRLYLLIEHANPSLSNILHRISVL